MDDERCYRAAMSRDGRFDGTFVAAVVTTRIYCRPSCPAAPLRKNVRFFPTPAAAQGAGFRACKRCRPDAAPGSPEWDARADVVARAVRLIGDGLVEREGVAGVARRVGYSPRHLTRVLQAELGTGPLRLAMARRVQTARALLETTELPVTDVAWAAGFASVRQFNDRIREVYALSPSAIRRGSRAAQTIRFAPSEPVLAAEQVLPVRLAFRPPFDLPGVLDFLGRRAVPGVEAWDSRTFATVLRLPRGLARATISADGVCRQGSRPAVRGALVLEDVRDYAAAVSRLRRLLDLDADPEAVSAVLGEDAVLAPLVAKDPGRRMPGAASPEEMAMRAVIGQQVSVASARATAGRLAALLGQPVDGALGGRPASAAAGTPGAVLAFPTPEAVAAADPAILPMPRMRARALQSLAAALADGRVDLSPGCDRDEAGRRLLALPGIGPWTAAYIRMRALGDPDVYLPGDVALARAERATAITPTATGLDPERWRPWRSYAVAHLWAAAPRPAPHLAPEPPPISAPTPADRRD